jgi:hypothetical protein
MPVDHIRYDLLTQQALRSVIRTVLADTVKGPRGDHHFQITFDTTAPGVRIAPRLRAQYPQEMTIILQHQFWDLIVEEDYFEVGLSFGGITERLRVPFEAIKAFFDPSVQFALQFQTAAEEGEMTADETAAGKNDSPRPEATRTDADSSRAAEASTDSGSGEAPDKPSGGAEVVRLDRFRKK